MTTRVESLIEELSAVGVDIVARGLALASGGNISARIDEDTFVVTGSGTWLDRLTPEDFSVMSLSGRVISGSASPSSEWKLHQRSYAARADVNAVVHVHPQHAVLLDALGHDVRLITLDHAYYVRSVGTTPYYPNGSDELADSAAEQAAHHDCIIMGHHGCSALGDSVSMAFRRALNLEEAATATYRALLLGDTKTAFPAEALAALHHA
ncbi:MULTISPECIES: class II aldolase/adducin family protein [Microbacterium]|uniref:Class II aldolase/adducin family protein n=1 Tax=Microbacterium aurugineum TaxID=2851642 RepID=A0ABY4J6M2_9MICO|nr:MULTISPECIES: class II aldolase/adducin family protein [Microbacterium]MCK8467665.1 class II aldolase/adducin family protein [Microbacterium aurugineum]MCZ4302581.1 class II aldolase/adducin family protein [Microbacterium oxydans]QEA27978.1 class II aldolase/adducin family protein [Microbacterium sp. CBA3102]UPL19253.1 class II aldolase/adducin family protein [Microbacterium aurugineum]